MSTTEQLTTSKRGETRRESHQLFSQLDADGSHTASVTEIADFVRSREELWTKLSVLQRPSEAIAARVAMELATGLKGEAATRAELTKEQFHVFRKTYMLDSAGSQEFFQRAVFANFDADGNHELDEEELDHLLEFLYKSGSVFNGGLGLPPKDEMRERIMEKCDVDGDNTLSFAEVRGIISGGASAIAALAEDDGDEDAHQAQDDARVAAARLLMALETPEETRDRILEQSNRPVDDSESESEEEEEIVKEEQPEEQPAGEEPEGDEKKPDDREVAIVSDDDDTEGAAGEESEEKAAAERVIQQAMEKKAAKKREDKAKAEEQAAKEEEAEQVIQKAMEKKAAKKREEKAKKKEEENAEQVIKKAMEKKAAKKREEKAKKEEEAEQVIQNAIEKKAAKKREEKAKKEEEKPEQVIQKAMEKKAAKTEEEAQQVIRSSIIQKVDGFMDQNAMEKKAIKKIEEKEEESAEEKAAAVLQRVDEAHTATQESFTSIAIEEGGNQKEETAAERAAAVLEKVDEAHTRTKEVVVSGGESAAVLQMVDEAHTATQESFSSIAIEEDGKEDTAAERVAAVLEKVDEAHTRTKETVVSDLDQPQAEAPWDCVFCEWISDWMNPPQIKK